VDTVRVEDPFLESLKGCSTGRFGSVIARHIDVNDTARGDVLRKENRRKLNLPAFKC
jgi:hypothetical protein